MKVVSPSREATQISLSFDELLILNAALNEICNGIEVFEFSTRIGAEKDEVRELLASLRSTIDKLEEGSL